METIPRSEWAREAVNLDLSSDQLPVEKALGLKLNVERDTLCFRIKIRNKPATRRGILSVVNSIEDPLGLGAPPVQSEISRQSPFDDDQAVGQLELNFAISKR